MNLSPNRGRGERRVPAAPAASCAKVESTRVSHHRYPGSPGVPARNGFNGLFRALPGDRLSCHRRQRIWRVKTRSGRHASAELTPASRRQDHTTSPSAAPVYAKGFDGHCASPPKFWRRRNSAVRQRAVNCSRETRPAITSARPTLPLHRIPPRVRDDRDTPLKWGGTSRDIELIWVRREGKFS